MPYDQAGYSPVPYPFADLDSNHVSVSPAHGLPIVTHLVRAALGIAGCCAGAGSVDGVSVQDIVAAMGVCQGYLEATMAILTAWEAPQAPKDGRPA